jgi:uncharacterized FAD-dependent dehydrogenase
MPSSNLRVRAHHIEVPVEAGIGLSEALTSAIVQHLHIPASSLLHTTVIRRALDTRRNKIRYVFSVDIELPASLAERLLAKQKVTHIPQRTHKTYAIPAHAQPALQPVVVGAGPCGLFAALTLAQAGLRPILLERGKPVGPRAKDVSQLYGKGILNPESNVCYGEGGAGTFSDGKLYTRVNDDRVTHVLEMLVARGANPDILIHNRPHLGTDKLVLLLENIRAHLTSLGAQYLFESQLKDIHVHNHQLKALVLHDGTRIDTSHAILATGHSAHSVWHMLHSKGVPLEVRPISVGFRIEHPQSLINSIRYRSHPYADQLPSADYRLAYNQPNARGVYSFCMCPGGVVVTTPTEAEGLCINGMSHAARTGRFANSAMVVTVHPQDYQEAGFHGTFAGRLFQEKSEQQAYTLGGGLFTAPACRVDDFMQGKISQNLPHSSYRRGLTPAPIHTLYPDSVISALKEALHTFNQNMKGFVSSEAVLIGVETRTASPIRTPRDAHTLQVPGIQGLYPAGEGMGYGGGIVSAAVDGVRTAEALLEQLLCEKP